VQNQIADQLPSKLPAFSAGVEWACRTNAWHFVLHETVNADQNAWHFVWRERSVQINLQNKSWTRGTPPAGPSTRLLLSCRSDLFLRHDATQPMISTLHHFFDSDATMHKSRICRRLGLPNSWPRSIQTALVHVMSLAHYALIYTRSWAANSSNARVRLAGKRDDLEAEAAFLREEIRIKDARLARIPPGQRPHYHATQRLAILELRAARGWSLARTARVFQVTQATIASWCKRLDEEGPQALLRVPVPVNKFPDFVGHGGAAAADTLSAPR
jgi:hypothetical protein